MKKNKIPVVVVSTFSGLDLFLLGMVQSGMLPAYANEYNKYAARIHAHNYKGPNGESLIRMLKLSDKESEQLFKEHTNPKDEQIRKNYIKEHIVEMSDGTYTRPERIQDVKGEEIRKLCHELYGEDIRIVLIGGPPCQDYSGLNSGESKNRDKLIFEYLRFLGELKPDVAIMEEVPEIVSPKHVHNFNEFLSRCSDQGYRIAYKIMNAVLYQGKQSRVRCITMMIHEDLQKVPVFPEGNAESAMRVEDFMDIDYFFSGHFSDKIKTKRDFMCTVTSGSPSWLKKDDVKRKPTNDELLKFQGVLDKHNFELPDGIPQEQILRAIGNAVPVNLAYHLGRTIMEKIFDQVIENEY